MALIAVAVAAAILLVPGVLLRVVARVGTFPALALGAVATVAVVGAACTSTARVLDELAARTQDVAHIDLDVTHRPDLASRFRVLQTPTTLILDGDGTVRARIGGAVRRDVVVAELDKVLAA